jgi:hypothetical protein
VEDLRAEEPQDRVLNNVMALREKAPVAMHHRRQSALSDQAPAEMPESSAAAQSGGDRLLAGYLIRSRAGGLRRLYNVPVSLPDVPVQLRRRITLTDKRIHADEVIFI